MKNDEKRPEEKVREKLVDFRTQLFIKHGEKGARAVFIGIPAALVTIILLTVIFFLLPVTSIEVTGDVAMFNEGEIISASEIEEGDSLFWRSGGNIKRTIKKNMPLAEDIKIKKSIFGKVSIIIDFDDVDFYIEKDGKFYAINSSLQVLDISDTASKYSVFGATKVILPEVREPVLGEKLVFYDTVIETDTEGETLYEVKEEKFYSYVSDFLKNLEKSGFLEQTDGVVLDEKFAVTIVYDMKYMIRFGSIADIEPKFNVLFKILNDDAMKSMEKVYIDLTQPSKATARPDNTLDFSLFDD